MKNKILYILCFAGISLSAIAAEKQPEPVDYKLDLVWMADGKTDEKSEYIYTINHSVGFKTIEKLKEYIETLPKGSKLTWAPGCIRMGGEPLLSSEKDMADFQAFCKEQGINLVIIPAG